MTSDELRPEAVDSAHELLSDRRRRYLLYELLEGGRSDVDELARDVAATELDAVPSAVSEPERKRVQTSLHHHHLPRLDDHGVIEYDVDRGTVVPAERFDVLEPFVRHAATMERRSRPAEAVARPRSSGFSD